MLNRPKKEPEEYEKIKKFFSEYFISENMDTLEIKNIKKQFIEGILNKYPQLPRDNMFGIDTDKFKSQLKEDEFFTL